MKKLLRKWFRTSEKEYDVAVSSCNLSGLVAAYASVLNGMSVVIFGATPKVATITGFDSLAPEGVIYLKHLLSTEQIEGITLGKFAGITRNGYFEAFDAVLRTGIQVDVLALKLLLWKLLIKAGGVHIPEEVVHAQNHKFYVELTTATQKVGAKWCLDGTGMQSALSVQSPTLLSPDLWVKRTVFEQTTYRNRVEFDGDNTSWTWKAYDAKGTVCVTSYETNCDTESDANEYVNCQWYKRSKCWEGRLLLLSPSYYRFDPSSGIGMTIQIKSALHASKLIAGNCLHAHPPALIRQQYEAEMNAFFTDVYTSILRFYAFPEVVGVM